MSFANPGSRQASSIGSLRRKLQVLPGPYFRDPFLLQRSTWPSSVLYMGYNGTSYGASAASYWSAAAAAGAMTTANITADVWTRILTVNARGILGAIVSPQRAAGSAAYLVGIRVTADGKSFTYVPKDADISSDRRLVLGSLEYTATAANTRDGLYSGNVSSETMITGSYGSTLSPHVVPVARMEMLNLPLLIFDQQLTVDVISIGSGISDSGVFEPRTQVVYRLLPEGINV